MVLERKVPPPPPSGKKSTKVSNTFLDFNLKRVLTFFLPHFYLYQDDAPTAPGNSYHKFKTFGIGACFSRETFGEEEEEEEERKRNRPPRASRDDDDAQKAKRRGASKASWILIDSPL